MMMTMMMMVMMMSKQRKRGWLSKNKLESKQCPLLVMVDGNDPFFRIPLNGFEKTGER